MKLRRENCRAGRALLGWSAKDLAEAANISAPTINSFEAGRTVELGSTTQEAIISAFELAGVLVIPENGAGQGVRFASNDPDPMLSTKSKPGPKPKDK